MTSRLRPSIDELALIKGASAGFTVLLVGELVAPLVSGLHPTVGLLWLSIVGAAGFVLAGSKIGVSRAPRLQGGVTALAALLLTIPLRMMAGLDTTTQWYAVMVSAAFGLVVGTIAGHMAGTVRDRARA